VNAHLNAELVARPEDAEVFRELVLSAAVFYGPEPGENGNDDFLILESRAGSKLPWQEWRCNLSANGLAPIQPWT
jgi:hypothetical protein